MIDQVRAQKDEDLERYRREIERRNRQWGDYFDQSVKYWIIDVISKKLRCWMMYSLIMSMEQFLRYDINKIFNKSLKSRKGIFQIIYCLSTWVSQKNINTLDKKNWIIDINHKFVNESCFVNYLFQSEYNVLQFQFALLRP